VLKLAGGRVADGNADDGKVGSDADGQRHGLNLCVLPSPRNWSLFWSG
jgi:hypothetical protein